MLKNTFYKNKYYQINRSSIIVEIQNVIGSTLKKTPSQDYIESFKLLIRGGFIKVSENNSLVLSTTAIKSMEKLIAKISRNFENYQPMKIYSSNQIEIAFEYLNSEIQSYRQLPSKSRLIYFRTNKEYYLKQGLLYPMISETLNFITITNSNNIIKDENAKLLYAVEEIFRLLNIKVNQFYSFNPFNRFEYYSENKELALLYKEGKEQYVICKKCDYYSRIEVATFFKRTNKEDELEMMIEIKTPGTNTIASLAKFLDVEESKCAKVVFYCYKLKGNSNIAVVIIRGDMEVSENKLKIILQTDELQFATNDELISISAVPGYASAIEVNREKCTVIVDDLIPESRNMVAGANKLDYHLLNTNYGRDYEADIVADITLVQDNSICTECNSKLTITNGLPLFTSSLINRSEIINFLDNKGKPQYADILISSFDITRIFGTLARVTDKFGVKLPHDLSPFQFVLMTIGNSDEIIELANNIYKDLKEKFDILFDNREVKFGVKLADADLRSIHNRIIISKKTLENNQVEFLVRGIKDRIYWQIEDIESELENIMNKS